MRRATLHALLLAAACLLAPSLHAEVLKACATAPERPAAEQDRLMQLAALVQAELARSEGDAAIVARSGLALQWLGHTLSHAGVSLRHNPQGPWAVRQLYFDCEDQRPRVFDQGLPGFVLGVHPTQAAHIVLLLPPPEATQALAQGALDDRQALALLGTAYSANAHAWSTGYQNCNQWLAELLGVTWATPPDATPTPPPHPREQAQAQLRQQGYQPSTVQPPWPPLVALAGLSHWLHLNDHPPADVAAGQLRVSMPASIEAWLRTRWPTTRRVALCQHGRDVVVHRGWDNIGPADACPRQPGDEHMTLAP